MNGFLVVTFTFYKKNFSLHSSLYFLQMLTFEYLLLGFYHDVLHLTISLTLTWDGIWTHDLSVVKFCSLTALLIPCNKVSFAKGSDKSWLTLSLLVICVFYVLFLCHQFQWTSLYYCSIRFEVVWNNP